MEKIIREVKLARGVLIDNDNILLVQDIRPGQGHFFLPGGNVEAGESIKGTLAREWEEELGWKVHAGAFIGCLEHKWSYNRKQDDAPVDVIEVNYLFVTEASAQTLKRDPTSREPHLKFSWVPIKELSTINLLPVPLKSLIPDIATAKPTAIWASTL
jgi:8-oxo-dGTP pyrophosphatase MutT (NUDIX family)